MPHFIDVGSPISTSGPIGKLGHILLPQSQSETAQTARGVLAADSDSLLDQIFTAAIARRATFPLLRHLAAASSLEGHSLAAEVWFSNSTSRTIGFPRIRTATGRIPLAELQRLFDDHRLIQQRILGELADAANGQVMVLFGQGISLLHPGYASRFSHDLDLLVVDDALASEVLRVLENSGFSIEIDLSSQVDGQVVRRWEFFKSYPEGNVMHVDLYLRGIADSFANQIVTPSRRVPPLLLNRAYERSESIDRGGLRVRAPRDEDSMLLVAQKAQRHLSLTFREIGDVAEVLANPSFDWELINGDIESYWLRDVTDSLVRAAQRMGVTGPPVDHAPTAMFWRRPVIPVVYTERCPARVRSTYRSSWRRRVAQAKR